MTTIWIPRSRAAHAGPSCRRRRAGVALSLSTTLALSFACREAVEDPETPVAPEAPAPVATPEPKTTQSWPKRAASLREVQNVQKDLEALVREGATSLDDPWSMAHGVVAFGPELRAADARFAVDAIVTDYIQSREEDGETIWFFPERTPGGRPLEVHDHLVAKVLATSGLPMSRSFALRGGREITLREIMDSVKATFPKPPTAHDWARQAWTLEGLFVSEEPGTKLQLDGWSPTYSELVGYSIEALARLQAFLEAPMKTDHPEHVEKKKQGIYAHTCGGLHFLQTAMHGAHRLGNDALLARAREQFEIARFRFDAERRIYRETIAEAPKFRTLLLVQEMKFFGHMLETFGLAAEWGAITPTPTLNRFIAEVAGDLVDTVRELDSAYAEIGGYESQGSQTYYDLIGDGCHAIRGLRLSAKHYFEEEAK